MRDNNEPTEPLALNALDRELIFLFFAMSECARAIDALAEVSRLAAVREIDAERGIERREWIRVFNSIRMALHFSGSVSRIFFPPRSSGPAQSRGALLRRLTAMPHTHPIRSRSLRDHVEHMDERLDKWTATTPRPFGGAIEMTVDEDMFKITRDAIEASCPFIYYRDMERVSIFGESFDLRELKATLEDVRGRLSRAVIEYHEAKGRGEPEVSPK